MEDSADSLTAWQMDEWRDWMNSVQNTDTSSRTKYLFRFRNADKFRYIVVKMICEMAFMQPHMVHFDINHRPAPFWLVYDHGA